MEKKKRKGSSDWKTSPVLLLNVAMFCVVHVKYHWISTLHESWKKLCFIVSHVLELILTDELSLSWKNIYANTSDICSMFMSCSSWCKIPSIFCRLILKRASMLSAHAAKVFPRTTLCATCASCSFPIHPLSSTQILTSQETLLMRSTQVKHRQRPGLPQLRPANHLKALRKVSRLSWVVIVLLEQTNSTPFSSLTLSIHNDRAVTM